MVVRCFVCKETQRKQRLCVCPFRMRNKIMGLNNKFFENVANSAVEKDIDKWIKMTSGRPSV
jgi:hypothetical protein